MQIAKTDVREGGSRTRIPKDRYRVRCTGAKFGMSSGGGKTGIKYPMTTLDCEIIDPETVLVDGVENVVAGRQFKLFLMNVADETWGQARVFEFMDKLKIPYGGNYDTELVDDYFKGMEWDQVLDSQEVIKRKAPQAGQKLGDPILDGEGKPISDGFQIVTDYASDVPVSCNPFKNENIQF